MAQVEAASVVGVHSAPTSAHEVVRPLTVASAGGPQNRGTGDGMLLTLYAACRMDSMLMQDPSAVLVVTPI
jgi:hypothetical protein